MPLDLAFWAPVMVGGLVAVVLQQGPRGACRVVPGGEPERPIEEDAAAFVCADALHPIGLANQAGRVVSFGRVAPGLSMRSGRRIGKMERALR